MEDVIIVGAGLSGLATAYFLKKNNISFKILEAQNRIGGRIKTIYGNQNTPMEMGATWFGQEHKNLLQFLSEINCNFFEQHNEGIALFETMSFEPPQQYFVPANTHSAFRLNGGTQNLPNTLYNQIGSENVFFNSEIVAVIDEGDKLKINDSQNNNFYCKHLVIAMPPKLLIHSIRFNPPLPQMVNQIMQKTQTWMSGSIKFSVEYKNPFWREKGFSGSVFSQSGLATEIYDHCNNEDTKFALKGFLSGSAIHYSFDERKEKVLVQLLNYFGHEANDYISYNDKIWNDQYIQPTNDTFLSPHFNNGHAFFQESYMNEKLFFTGTETAEKFSGYMEGAIIASKTVSQKLIHLIQK